MQYGHIDHVSKPISHIVFGTATPKMFAAFRSVFGEARILTPACRQLSSFWTICTPRA